MGYGSFSRFDPPYSIGWDILLEEWLYNEEDRWKIVRDTLEHKLPLILAQNEPIVVLGHDYSWSTDITLQVVQGMLNQNCAFKFLSEI